MISLRTEPDGYEFLAPAPFGPHQPDGAVFAPADAYGFDDMFPGVYPQKYPTHPWQEMAIADHGDLWYRPWRYPSSGEEATLWLDDARMGWRFDKTLRFVQPRALEVTYRVENRSRHPLHWLYCAHILCPYRPGVEIDVPVAEYRRDETMGEPLPERCTEKAEFLRRFEAFPDRSAAFYVSDAVGSAECTWIDRVARKALRLTWTLPLAYLAMWYNRSAWMPDRPLTHVGLEPTTAGSQDLAGWVQSGAAQLLAPGARVTWTLALSAVDL
jgi:galactose mutarotase-like enzyme